MFANGSYKSLVKYKANNAAINSSAVLNLVKCSAFIQPAGRRIFALSKKDCTTVDMNK